jgi:hypothetical protein
MTDKHMNIFIQLCMNKYIYKNIKNDTLKKMIELIHKRLYIYEKDTQYYMIRMMIKCEHRVRALFWFANIRKPFSNSTRHKYAKIFKIKKIVYNCNDRVYPLYSFALGYYNKSGIFVSIAIQKRSYRF